MSIGKRIRGSFAALLSAALIVSGATLAAPAAFAEEGDTPTEIVETTTPQEQDELSEVGDQPGGQGESEETSGDDASALGPVGSAGNSPLSLLLAPLSVDEPSVVVSKTTGLNPLGDTITVTGTGFDSTTGADVNRYRDPALNAGVYVQLGWIKDGWAPSAGGSASGVDPKRAGPINKWVSNKLPAPIFWTDEATGSFSVTFDSVTKAALTAGMPEGARPAVFTMVAGGAPAQAKYEFAYDLEFSAEDDGGDDGDDDNGGGDNGEENNGGGDNGIVVPQTAGVLNWGISTTLATYTEGSIAKGRISTSGVGRSGNIFSFPQSSSSWNAAARLAR